jgi:hypothetical protein
MDKAQNILDISADSDWWFGGVENLVRNDYGYVFWKGQMIYLLEDIGDINEQKRVAEKIGARCRFLESGGAAINVGNIYLFED